MKIKPAWSIFLVLGGLLFVPLSCAKVTPPAGNIDRAGLTDGTYEGRCQSGPMRAVVRVTIENQRIADIELVSHWAWRGKKAGPIILGRIIEQQSAKVDAVSGATSSSHVIMYAVQNALEKAATP